MHNEFTSIASDIITIMAIRPGRGRPKLPADAWRSVSRRGRNGIFLLIIGLLWLGRAIFGGTSAHLRETWDTLVDDLAWVLSSSGTDIEADGKRKAAATSSPRKRSRLH